MTGYQPPPVSTQYGRIECLWVARNNPVQPENNLMVPLVSMGDGTLTAPHTFSYRESLISAGEPEIAPGTYGVLQTIVLYNDNASPWVLYDFTVGAWKPDETDSAGATRTFHDPNAILVPPNDAVLVTGDMLYQQPGLGELIVRPDGNPLIVSTIQYAPYRWGLSFD